MTEEAININQAKSFFENNHQRIELCYAILNSISLENVKILVDYLSKLTIKFPDLRPRRREIRELVDRLASEFDVNAPISKVHKVAINLQNHDFSFYHIEKEYYSIRNELADCLTD